MSTVNNKHGELQITFSTLESKQRVPYHHFSVFYFHLQSQVAVTKKKNSNSFTCSLVINIELKKYSHLRAEIVSKHLLF